MFNVINVRRSALRQTSPAAPHALRCALQSGERTISITVTIDRSYRFDVAASADKVFALLADVPKSASYFPNLERLVDLGHHTYLWELGEVGLAHASLRTVYACRYEADRAKGLVSWKPVKGKGNALVSGNWKISTTKRTTRVALKIKGELTLPLPGLMQMIIAPVAEKFFDDLIERYIRNLSRHFGELT